MTVQGLESNGYLINNPIIVSVTSTDIMRLEINFLNEQNGKSVTLPSLYPNPNNQIVTFNIDSVIKGLFTEPNHNDYYLPSPPIIIPESTNRFIISFTAYILGGANESETITKTFIRGGKYNDLTNQTIPANSYLKTTERFPVFSGYPFAYYWLSGDYKVEKRRLTGGSSNVPVEHLREKSCNGKYLKFLNSLGGYSYWYFDNYEEESSSSNVGIVNNGFNQKDLGNNYSNGFKVFGKVPQRFYPMMKDLIFSPEILEWQKETQTWKRIYSDGNKWVANGAKNAYKVDYKFSDFNNYNPTLIW